MNPTTPAIAGAGQSVQRPGDWARPEDARGAIELIVDAARAAAADAGSARLLAKVGWIGVAGGFFPHVNPGQVVAEQLGIPDAATALSTISGSAPQDMLTLAATRIASGRLDAALIVGGEARWSQKRLVALGERPQWIRSPGTGTPEPVGAFDDDLIEEMGRLGVASTAYALFEDSLRIGRGRDLDTHRSEIAGLWSRFSSVAAANPYAWDRAAHTALSIREASAANRMIAFPYPKAMVANNTVDLASAILLCSVHTAQEVGISGDRLVFPHVATTGEDTVRIAERDVLHETPALAAAGNAALKQVGITVEEIAHLDLYACFPSIVEMSCESLGIDPKRALTLTGGLGFAGAAVSNSSGHAIAAMVPRAREGGWALIHANGGGATKHAFGIYAAHPPEGGFRHLDERGRTPLNPRRRAGRDWPGKGSVEAATVVYDRSGPTHVVASLRAPDGSRGLVRSDDADLIDRAHSDGLAGMAGPLPGWSRLDPPA